MRDSQSSKSVEPKRLPSTSDLPDVRSCLGSGGELYRKDCVVCRSQWSRLWDSGSQFTRGHQKCSSRVQCRRHARLWLCVLGWCSYGSGEKTLRLRPSPVARSLLAEQAFHSAVGEARWGSGWIFLGLLVLPIQYW